MTGFAYLGALLLSLGGMALIDRRYRLAFWAHPRRTAVCLGAGVVGFLAWDVAGLLLGIFARGESPHLTGLLLAPELPVEEAVFLTLLCYVALIAWRWFDRQAALRARWATEHTGHTGHVEHRDVQDRTSPDGHDAGGRP